LANSVITIKGGNGLVIAALNCSPPAPQQTYTRK